MKLFRVNDSNSVDHTIGMRFINENDIQNLTKNHFSKPLSLCFSRLNKGASVVMDNGAFE
ncbi:MAG: hypothetical protein WC327_04075 [Candidatus Cloacimonadia bacterium]